MMYGICANCGAEAGLHHYETSQCPLHGIEETRDRHPQRWADTTFKEKQDALLEDCAPRMLAAIINAEKFLSGFEDDPGQEGINELINQVRSVIADATKKEAQS